MTSSKLSERMDPQISLVIPVLDEEETIPGLAEEIDSIMNSSAYSWECIWIDDGSKDRTYEILKELNEKNKRHEYIIHQGNYGQSMALFSGFRRARGQIIATMDGDGQNDPSDIPGLVEHLKKENADMVNGWRRNRQDSVIRKISSRIGNGFRNCVTRENVHDVGCSMRVFRRHCLEHLIYFKGMHRYLPTLVNLDRKYKIVEKTVRHRTRKGGRTKYGINNRLWVGLIDTLFIRWILYRVKYPEEKMSSFNTQGREN